MSRLCWAHFSAPPLQPLLRMHLGGQGRHGLNSLGGSSNGSNSFKQHLNSGWWWKKKEGEETEEEEEKEEQKR